MQRDDYHGEGRSEGAGEVIITKGLSVGGQKSTGNIGLAGAATTILVWVFHEATGRAVPTEIAMAVQTVLLAYISHSTIN